ncbi:MAG: PQQ-dependent sugar dehydrogenase [Actinomycetota bacterium]
MSRFRPVLLALAVILAVPTPVATALPAGTQVQTYEGGLSFPVDMAWVKGTKKIFFTEKNSGAVRIMVGRRLRARPCVNLDVDPSGESGGLGIALHPNFKDNHFLYVYYTNASPRENRVSRFKVVRNRCRRKRNIVTGLLAGSSPYHNGGQLEFMNGYLFVSTGEAHRQGLAQRIDSPMGKVLRVRGNGDIPNDNPFGPNNPVWSYGHRNPFGLAARPGSSELFETENGPNCDDELNRIYEGRNYGWGDGYQCGGGVGVNPEAPLVRYSDIIVPTDPTWYTGRLRALRGLLMGDFSTGRIHRFVMNDDHTRVTDDIIVHNHAGNEGIVDVATGPGRWVYFLTPDSIMRIVRR